MKALRILNKEQWTALVVSLVALYGVAGAAWSGGAGASEIPTADDRVWKPAPARFPETVDDDFKKYCPDGALGRVFKAEATTKLDIPVLSPPEPREGTLTAPLFQPGPSMNAYNSSEQVKVKYIPLIAGSPAVPEGDLPTPEKIQTLIMIEEPVPEPTKDARMEREREFFEVTLKREGVVHKGELVLEEADVITIKTQNSIRRYKKSDLAGWKYNRTHEEQYRLDSQKIQSGPKEAAERMELAQRLIGLGMIPEAKEELKKAIAAKPDDLAAILKLGDMLFDEMDLDGAIATYEAGLEAGAPPAELHYGIGRCLRALNFYEGAAEAYNNAVTLSPRFKKGRLALARMYLRLGRLETVIKDLKDFLIRFGRDRDTTDEHRREAHLLRGLAHLRLGDLPKAKENLAESLKLGPTNAEALNANGVILGLEGKYKDAGTAFVAAIESDQYLTDAWCNLGALLLLGGRTADAEAVYGAAAQRDPLAAEPLAGIGLARILADKKDEGIASLDAALAINPRHVAALATKAHLKLLEGADVEALKGYEAALQAEYDYIPAWYGTALAYMRKASRTALDAQVQRDRAKAAEMIAAAQRDRINAATLLSGARRYDPTNPQIMIALGCTYAVMGRADEAGRVLRSANDPSTGAPPDPLVHYARGFVSYWYEQAESVEKRLDYARSEFVRGANLKADPKDPHAVRAVALCKKAMDDIDHWNSTSIRLDDAFNRPEGEQLGGGWLEQDKRHGIQVSLAFNDEQGGHALFEGMQKIADMGITMFDRKIPSANFLSLEMTFRPLSMPKAELGMSIFFAEMGKYWMGVHVGRDMDGKLKYKVCQDRELDRNDMQVGWNLIKTPPPAGPELRLRLVRTEKKRQEFLEIWAYDSAVGDWTLLQKDVALSLAKKEGQWRIAAWGRGWKDQEYSFTVDDIRVYDRKRRGQ